MNDELKREALFYPNLKINIKTVKDNSKKQIEDIEKFIAEGVDLLIVSPNEAKAITPVVEKAYDKGIPVVLVDRRQKNNLGQIYRFRGRRQLFHRETDWNIYSGQAER